MKIRKATKKDIPVLVKLVRGDKAVEDYPGEYSAPVFKDLLSWAHVLIAEEGKVPVGLAVYYSGASRKRAYLEAITVSEKHRGRGIGRALVSEMEKRVK